MINYVLVLMLSGNIATAPVTFQTLDSCQISGELWKDATVRSSSFICLPVATKD